LEKRIAALEGGIAAVAVASGQSAHFLTFNNLAGVGDNIISSPSLYGGSYNQLKVNFAKLGVGVKFAKKDTESVHQLIDEKTKAIFTETMGNSDFYIPDFEQLAEIAHEYNIPLIVDNTFGGAGYLFKPKDYGANIITHAATKWIGGHGNSIGGVIVDAGNFNWANGNFPEYTNPCVAYHGLVFWDEFKEAAFAVSIRALGLRTWGCALSPMNAFLLLQGVETLSLRMDRMLENTVELAHWLQAHPKVESVHYPGLKSHPSHLMAKKYFKKGFGGVLSFCVKGDRASTAKMVEKLELIIHLVNVGDNKTLISHPASTTHSQLSQQALEAAGITENTLRLAVGIEHIDDLKQDLNKALNQL
jgi:O-acetylhomoserine (thiol)-lyase